MDMEQLAGDVAEVVRGYVGPLRVQLAALTAEVAELRALAPVHGKDGAPGKDGANGKDGLNGKDGAAGRDGLDGAVGKDGAAGVAGRDGADGIDGQKGDKGEEGAPATVDLIELAGILRHEPEFVAMCKGDAGPKGADGLPGRDGLNGRDGKDGEKGLAGDRGFDGENGRDGRDGKDGIKGDSGEDGARGDTGMQGKDGAPGRDGFSLDDFQASTPDGGRTIVLAYASGELRRSFELRTAIVLDAGGYKPSAAYLKGDGVTYGGQFFIAQEDVMGVKPGDSKSWRLAVRRGADGKVAE